MKERVLCKDCIHFQPWKRNWINKIVDAIFISFHVMEDNRIKYSKCKLAGGKIKEIDYVSGNDKIKPLSYCKIERSKYGNCGEEGKFFDSGNKL